jgi:hypothetical protein
VCVAPTTVFSPHAPLAAFLFFISFSLSRGVVACGGAFLFFFFFFLFFLAFFSFRLFPILKMLI